MSKSHSYILGINAYDHDVSACLLRDGEIAYAIAKARELGAEARADAVRRHGQSSVQLVTTGTYSVTMDFGADGVVTTQTFPLENNVTFITELKTITFDWRGRVPEEVSVGFGNEAGTANVNITGSGDVTIDSEIFHDTSVPNLDYNENVSAISATIRIRPNA